MQGENRFQPLYLRSDDSLPSLMLTPLTSWGIVTITGEDKNTYLQGQITCDVTQLNEKESTLGAHCDPKGKVWSVFRLFHHHDRLAMFQPASAIEKELAELKKYAVFSNVTFDVSEEIRLGVVGVQADEYIDSLSEERGHVRTIPGGTAVKISSLRWLLVLDSAAAEQTINTFAGEKVEEAIWRLLDIQEAIPIIEARNQNEYIPQAINIQALHGISFTKGCYTGQETIARAKYRGINKRAMYIVQGTVPMTANLSPIELERSVGDNWRSVGELFIQYVFDNGFATGLIVLPNNLDAETQLRMAHHPHCHWEILPLPYSLEDND